MEGKSTYINGYYETRINNITANAAITTIDLSEANIHNISLEADTIIHFSNEHNGTFILIIEQTGVFDVAYEPRVRWASNVAPVMTKTVGKKDLIYIIASNSNFLATTTQNH